MNSLIYKLDRFDEMISLLKKMSSDIMNPDFWKWEKELKDKQMLFRLENEINEHNQ